MAASFSLCQRALDIPLSCVFSFSHDCARRYLQPHRFFILDLVQRNIPFHEAIMNLPANATDFLDVFIGLFSRVGEDK